MPRTFATKPLRSRAPLSKSRFTRGIQCPLALYLSVRTDAVIPEPSLSDQMRFDVGNRVNEVTHARFERLYGVDACAMIEADFLHQNDAVAETAAAMAAGKMAILEAGFTHGGVKVRVDVLERVGDDEWDLIEVKSTRGYKKEKHLWDAAVQTWVARGAGVNVRRTCLMHLDKSYVWPGGEYDPMAIMTEADITAAVAERILEVPTKVDEFLAVVRSDEPPAPSSEVSCERPYPCPFSEYCAHIGVGPEHPIGEIPFFTRRMHAYQGLAAAGKLDLRDIDDALAREVFARDYQYCTWKATIDGTPFMLDSAEEFLDKVDYPLYFLDFETVSPGLPVFVGTSPYDVIPVQYSIHVLDEPGAAPRHVEYIAQPGSADPRSELATRLLQDLGMEGTILEWHGMGGYESKRIEGMAELLPQHAERLRALNSRMLDLALLVRDHFFHKDFHGSFSIKVVLPTLVPGMRGYAGMKIHDGDGASMALIRVLTDESMPDAEREQTVADLLAYCELDTEAMVEVWRALLSHRALHGCVSL
jgi:hypothetical protein